MYRAILNADRKAKDVRDSKTDRSVDGQETNIKRANNAVNRTRDGRRSD